MSDTTGAPATEPTATEPTEEAKPTETVDFWKQKAREQEKRAKANADAADRLAAIEEASKTEAEKTAERIAKAEAEVAGIPSKVADALRSHLVVLHEIDADDAELFLTANDPDLLIKQVTRLLGQSAKRPKQTNHVPREGTTPREPVEDEMRAFARHLFKSGDTP